MGIRSLLPIHLCVGNSCHIASKGGVIREAQERGREGWKGERVEEGVEGVIVPAATEERERHNVLQVIGFHREREIETELGRIESRGIYKRIDRWLRARPLLNGGGGDLGFQQNREAAPSRLFWVLLQHSTCVV